MPQPRNQKDKVTLDQLTPEARQALLTELRADTVAQAEAVASIAEQSAAVRNRATGRLLHDRDHLRDCPGGRVEAYESRRPPQPSQGRAATDVTVVRCVECGGSTVLEQPYAATVAAIDQAAADIAAEIETEEVPS